MSKLKEGELRVTIDYEHLSQDIKAAIAFLERIRDKLDIAAIQDGIRQNERRIGERRSKAIKPDRGCWP